MASSSIRYSLIETGSLALRRCWKKSISMIRVPSGLRQAGEPGLEMASHGGPFAVYDRKYHGVPQAAVGEALVVAQDAVLLGAEPGDRLARGMVEPVGPELDRDAVECLEGVPRRQGLAFGVERGALDRGGVPRGADLEPTLPWLDVHVPGRSDDALVAQAPHHEGQGAAGIALVEGIGDPVVHVFRPRHLGVPEVPELPVGRRVHELGAVGLVERLEPHVTAH